MVSAISIISSYDQINDAPSLTPPAQSPYNVRQDSIDVIDHYGVAPAYVASVAYYAPAYEANHNADVVSAAAPVTNTPREPGIGTFLDELA
jgi:hypothetical protein